MAVNDNLVPGSISEAKGCAIPGHHGVIALESLTCTATNDVLQREGRQGRVTWHRVEKLLCRQQAHCRCKRLAGWEIHTLELLLWPLSQPQRKGCPLGVHHRHQWRAAVPGMWWAARTRTAFQGHGLNEGRQLSAAQQLPPFPHSIQSTRAGDRSDLCRLMSRVKQKPSCCQQQSEPATVCQNVDAGLQGASLAEHPDTLLMRQKIKPKQDKQKKARQKKSITCGLLQDGSLACSDFPVSPVSETQSSGQQCYLGGAEQNCGFQDFPWPQLWSLHSPVKWVKYELEITHRHSAKLWGLRARSCFLPVHSGTCAVASQAGRTQHRCFTPISPLPPKTRPSLSQWLKREWGSLSSAGPLTIEDCPICVGRRGAAAPALASVRAGDKPHR